MRCPNCGATNPDTAQWCGQCLARFDVPAADGQPQPQTPGSAASAAPAPGAAVASPAGDVTSSGGNFRRRGEEIEWACPACGEFNSIDLLQCTVCGTEFAAQFRTEPDDVERNWTQAMAMSAIVPGSGHIGIGRYGSGWARLVLFMAWLLGGVLLAAGGGSRATLAALPLFIGALVVWAVSLVDLTRLRAKQEELLIGRRLLWLVIGVLVLLGVAMFASLMPAAA